VRGILALTLLMLLYVVSSPRAGAADVGAPFKAPYVPAGDAAILQEVPSISDPAVANMNLLQATRSAMPQSVTAAIELARAYVDYSRQIGDAHYAGYAEAVIAPWMRRPSPPPDVLVTQAAILQYRHQFADARELLKKAIKLEPRTTQAWISLATLDMVQGDYLSAGKDCAQVTNSAGFDLGSACSANLLSYVGQAGKSLELLRYDELAAEKMPASYRAWIQGLIAEAAERLGNWPLAETHYLKALSLLPQDNFLLVAYADFLLDRGRPEEVLTLLAAHMQSDTAFLRLALARSALQRPDAGRYAWIMSARLEALSLRGSDYFGREQARFALQLQHDPETALDMARRNWRVQRAPWDARVFLEAALAAHQPEVAAEVLAFIRQSKLQDASVEPLARQVRDQMQVHGE
jgi:tetratricopeptide (TPR) repeat protein